MAYIARRFLEESGHVDGDILSKMDSRKGMGRLKIKCTVLILELWANMGKSTN